MAVEYNSNRKCCATCEMWQGKRKLGSSKGYVVAEGNAQGVCFSKNKTYLGNYSSCPNFKKWALLK